MGFDIHDALLPSAGQRVQRWRVWVGVLVAVVLGAGAWLWFTRSGAPPPRFEQVTELAWRWELVPKAAHPHPMRAWILRARYADGFEAIGGRPVLATEFDPPGHPAGPVVDLVESLRCAGTTCAWMALDPLFGPQYTLGPHPQDLVFNLWERPAPPCCEVRIQFSVAPGDGWRTWLVGRMLVEHWHEYKRLDWLPVPQALNWENFVTLTAAAPQVPCDQVRDRLFAAEAATPGPTASRRGASRSRR